MERKKKRKGREVKEQGETTGYIKKLLHTCVGSDVFLQCAKASEHLLTLATLVRLVLAVHWQVNFEIGRPSKAPSTLITLKRLLP